GDRMNQNGAGLASGATEVEARKTDRLDGAITSKDSPANGHAQAESGDPFRDIKSKRRPRRTKAAMGSVRDPIEDILVMLCGGCGVDAGAIDEYYMVKDDLWKRAGKRRYLCIGCLEERIGRKLTPDDFTDCPLNHEQRIFARSGRLRDRLSAGAT